MTAINELADFVRNATETFRKGPEVEQRDGATHVYAMPPASEARTVSVDVHFMPGTATPDQEVALLGYEAGCHTCGADMAGESDEEPDYVFTEDDAKEWARDHRCEKDTYITKPAGVS